MLVQPLIEPGDTMTHKKEKYSVDDRGNVAQFYDVESGDIIATIDREATVNGVQDRSTWDAHQDLEITKWAIANGYPEVATMPSANDAVANPALATYLKKVRLTLAQKKVLKFLRENPECNSRVVADYLYPAYPKGEYVVSEIMTKLEDKGFI